SLQALKKISQEHPTAYLQVGAHGCAFLFGLLLNSSADFVMEVVPLLTNLLQYHDSKVISYFVLGLVM
ncbi:hypothetical protein SESBI_00935, partial [Sesbania bispinosa]